MPYCIYLRKSRADAEAESRGEGETLARHEKALLELARRQSLNITQIHKEIVSGETIAARPVMQQLLEEVEQGVWDGVLVMEVERLARGDTMDQGLVAQTFKYSDTKIITPAKTYDPNNEFDEEYFEFGLFMSRREYKTINRRLQRGRLAAVKEGKYVGNIPPYGYRRIKLEHDTGFTLEPVPQEADTVRLIYNLYTDSSNRMGCALIARRLNELSIPARKKDHWTAYTIRGILSNPVYIGKVRWDCRKSKKKRVDGVTVVSRPRTPLEECTITQGIHPALISEEVFYKAIEITKSLKPLPLRSSNTVHNPLCSLIVCANCGRKLVRRPAGSRQNYDVIMCQDPHCTTVGSALHLVEARLLDSLEEWCNEYNIDNSADAADSDMQSIELKEKALTTLEQEADKLKFQLDNLHDLLEQGVYDAATFLDRSKRLAERIKKNNADRELLSETISNDRKRYAQKSDIIPKVKNVLAVYNTLPDAEAKNNMLREIIDKVVYTKTTRGTRKAPADNFTLTLYPRLPFSN